MIDEIGYALLLLSAAVFVGFGCYAVWCLAGNLKARTAAIQPRRVARAVQLKPQSIEEFKQEVEARTPKTCPQCATPIMGTKCQTCDYVPPIGYTTRRESFSTAKRRIENAQPQIQERKTQ